MSEITEKDVKRLWVEKGAICVELKEGRIGRELIRDYEPLRMATRKQLENFRIDCDGVWFDDLDEGLELSGFFSGEKDKSYWPRILAVSRTECLGVCPSPGNPATPLGCIRQWYEKAVFGKKETQ